MKTSIKENVHLEPTYIYVTLSTSSNAKTTKGVKRNEGDWSKPQRKEIWSKEQFFPLFYLVLTHREGVHFFQIMEEAGLWRWGSHRVQRRPIVNLHATVNASRMVSLPHVCLCVQAANPQVCRSISVTFWFPQRHAPATVKTKHPKQEEWAPTEGSPKELWTIWFWRYKKQQER